MVRTVLAVAGYWAVSSVGAFLPCKLTRDQIAAAHSQSCALGYLNLLSSHLRGASCPALSEGICSKTEHKLHFESVTRRGGSTGPWGEQAARARLCSPVALALSRELWAVRCGAPGPPAVSEFNTVAAWCCKQKGPLTERLREIRPRTHLWKDFLNPASPNYTFVIPFCILNSNLRILHLVIVVF